MLAGLFGATAVLLLAGRFLIAAGGVAALAVSLFTWVRLQSLLYVERPGRVDAVVDPDDVIIWVVQARVVVDDPPSAFWTPTSATRPTRPGDTVTVLVPMHRRGRVRVEWEASRPPAAGPVLLLGRWRIAFARQHWIFGRPVWKDLTAEALLDLIGEIISDGVLGWHRSRCEKLAVPLESTSEFLGLSAAFDVSWRTIVQRGLRDQTGLFDATERSREEAARRSFRLILVALAAIPIGILVVPRLVRVVWAALRSFYLGSLDPLRQFARWPGWVPVDDMPRPDLWVVLASWVVGAVLVVAIVSRTVSGSVSARHAWRADLTAAVRWRLLDEYRKVANTQDPPTLQVRTAPGLAALTTDQVIARDEANRLSALVFDLGAGAVAISGSRGVGKTTMLSSLTGPENETTLGLVVAAPVRYEPKDFLLHLYAELCAVVLDRLGARQAPSRLRRVLGRVRRALAAVILTAAVVCALALVFPGTREWFTQRYPLPQLPWTWALAATTLLVIAVWVRGPRPATAVALAAEATRRLRQTRYLQTVSTERSAGLGQSSMQAGWRRARQWAEQPHTLPDVVQSYRQFAADVADWWRSETGGRGKLLIGIDEADRIADPAAAELFVNEIKAIFGVPHCVYLVSVSEEALANFERRVVRMRTVFDSAFDHVIRLRPLTLRESVDLLRHRIAGVPDRAWVLCHSLAGGMPRDVLRTARDMIDVHRSSHGPSSIDYLAHHLVELEVQSVKRGFRLHTGDQPDRKLSELLADPEWPGGTGAELRAAAEEQLSGGGSAVAIGAALLYYATVLDLFTERADLVDVWDGQGAEAGEPELITELARVHSLLAVDPAVAVAQLQRIQAYLADEERRTGVLS
ncbi:hypothetical protein AB0C07_01395 [Actinoplanes missouriensis]|uniref:hypothetical protein n=1 Tax=Actinoplanes missouriensis TaxID=1866 RepID=UPI0033F1E0CF